MKNAILVATPAVDSRQLERLGRWMIANAISAQRRPTPRCDLLVNTLRLLVRSRLQRHATR
ncbi:MAG TPA: hypothetical protein VMD08_11070 [Candidatus Baltobacteraceae bacterium]|nr:hypothetical protein [Candidatus Baltobacteraceae bacterium]